LDDGIGDSTVEAYGYINFFGARQDVAISWNRHRCERDCLITSHPPYTKKIRTGSDHNWSDFFLASYDPYVTFDPPGSSFRQSNNVIIIRRSGREAIAQPLTMSWIFYDHADISRVR
jgi:hypothetical protein